MNRRSIMLASALLITAGVSNASAQVPMAPHVGWGILAGANFAKLSGNNVGDVKSRTGLVGGLSLDFHLAPVVGIEVDGLYSQEGAKFPDDADFKLDYVRVPVLLRLTLPTHTPVHPFLTVGPSFGFKVSCKESQGSSSTDCNSGDGTDVKSFDAAGTVGAGVGFGLGGHELSVTGRYSQGFTKIVSGSDVKTRNIALMAGLSF